MLDNLFSLLNADWDRLKSVSQNTLTAPSFFSYFSPRFAPVVLIRFAHELYVRKWRRLSKILSLLNFLIFGLEVPAKLFIGPGLVLPHPQGTILGASVIGCNATIFQQVTLGAKTADFQYTPSKRPQLADGVTVAAGAKVLGGITLGENVIIGANAVVLSDVPPNCIAVGVPARILKRDPLLLSDHQEAIIYGANA